MRTISASRAPSALPTELLPDHSSVGDDGWLSVAGCKVEDLVEQFGTPLFVYDEDHVRERCRQALAAFGADSVAYASKAFLCLAMARLVHEEGLHLDVSSGGEVYVAQAAGVPGDRLILHGNNKSTAELAEALHAGVGRIIVDSFDELDRLDALHASTGSRPKVLLRVTPGVRADDVHTPAYAMTGVDDTKFGFTASTGLAEEAIRRAQRADSVELVGLHTHIGSQMFDLDNFNLAIKVIADLARPYDLPEFCFGGGLGVAYTEDDLDGDHPVPSFDSWRVAINDACEAAGVDASVKVEPGRAIVANAAITLYEVGTIKELPDIGTYVSVDGGMSDNIRPALYEGGYEAFLPRAANRVRDKDVRVVGKHCESGDLLVWDGKVPSDIAVGDILATPVTGAYGYSMGSNYNKVPRPAVVFARDGDARLVVRRESYKDLLRNDV